MQKHSIDNPPDHDWFCTPAPPSLRQYSSPAAESHPPNAPPESSPSALTSDSTNVPTADRVGTAESDTNTPACTSVQVFTNNTAVERPHETQKISVGSSASSSSRIKVGEQTNSRPMTGRNMPLQASNVPSPSLAAIALDRPSNSNCSPHHNRTASIASSTLTGSASSLAGKVSRDTDEHATAVLSKKRGKKAARKARKAVRLAEEDGNKPPSDVPSESQEDLASNQPHNQEQAEKSNFRVPSAAQDTQVEVEPPAAPKIAPQSLPPVEVQAYSIKREGHTLSRTECRPAFPSQGSNPALGLQAGCRTTNVC